MTGRERTKQRPSAIRSGATEAHEFDAVKESVSALERGFSVLHCFKPGCPALAHQQIVGMTGLPKATVSRITQTLVKLGYLDASHEDGRFRLTAKVLDVGHTYLANVSVRAIAHPMMRQLAELTGATVNLLVRSGDSLVIVEIIRSEDATFTINSKIGSRFPILHTAIGHAYIAGLPKAQRTKVIKDLRSTVAAHAWASCQKSVERALQHYDKNGFCVLWGEWRLGVNSAAVPVRARLEDELYVINCAGPATHLGQEFVQKDVGPRLIEIARRVEQEANISWKQT